MVWYYIDTVIKFHLLACMFWWLVYTYDQCHLFLYRGWMQSFGAVCNARKKRWRSCYYDGKKRPSTRPGGKPVRVHLENLEISWNFEKINKYHGKITWNLEKLGGYYEFTLDSLETIQNSLNYWSRKEGLLILGMIEIINFLFKWNSISLHIYSQNHLEIILWK